MSSVIINTRRFLLLACIFALFTLLNCVSVFAEETLEAYVTIDRVNFRTAASTAADIIRTLNTGTAVQVSLYDKDGWSAVTYDGVNGYIKSEFIIAAEDYKEPERAPAELLNWSEVKHIFTIGADAAVYDVRTGLTYYVRSFSNGLHADVEPITKEDTAVMLKTYGGHWAWDPRPVFVTVNGRTIAGSINGMPHGGGVNSGNGMDGQVCIHFRESRTHNGNAAFTRDHQDAITEAWNAR